MSKMVDLGLQYLGIGNTGKAHLIEYYNKHCFPLVEPNRRYRMSMIDNWCAMFMSVLAHMVGHTKETFPFEVSVYYQCMRARQLGMLDYTSQFLRVGDLVVYDWGGGAGYNHVGIVSNIVDDRLDVLEGNYRGTVAIRNVSKRSKSLQAFILVDRHASEEMRLYDLAHRTLRGEFGNGDRRRQLLGSDYSKVQEIINKMA